MANNQGKIVYAYTNELSLDLSKCLYIGIQKKRPKGRFERMKEHASSADPQAEKFRKIKYIMLAEVDDMTDVNYIESILIRKYRPEMNTRENPEEYKSISRYDKRTEKEAEKKLDWFITDNTYDSPLTLDLFFKSAKEKLRDYYNPGLSVDEIRSMPLDDLLAMLKEHGRIRTGLDRYYGDDETLRVFRYEKNEQGKERISFSEKSDGRYWWKKYEDRSVTVEPIKKYNEFFDVTEVFEPQTMGGLISKSRSKKWFLEEGETYGIDGTRLTEREKECLVGSYEVAGYNVDIRVKYNECGIDMDALDKDKSFWKSEILNGIFCLAAEQFSIAAPELANEKTLKTITGRTLGILSQDYDLPPEAIDQAAALKNAVAALRYYGWRPDNLLFSKKIATLAEEIDVHCITKLEGLSMFCDRLSKETQHRYGFITYRDIALCKCAYAEYEKLMNGEDLSYNSYWMIEESRGNI